MAETIGSLVDKISIAELKIYHMAEQVDRRDSSDEARARSRDKLDVLHRQRDDLAQELTTLLADVLAGRVRLKVYRQFKMYNDPQYRFPTTPENRP
jgi:hypothetical protein